MELQAAEDYAKECDDGVEYILTILLRAIDVALRT